MRAKLNSIVKLIFAVLLFTLTMSFINPPLAKASGGYSYEDLPEEMRDNVFLDSLAYLGYDTDYVVNNGYNPELLGWKLKTNYSGIVYWDGSYNVSAYVYARTGKVVNKNVLGTAYGSEETKDGLPDVAAMRKLGTQCGGVVYYMYYNYLHNVAGYDMSWYRKTENQVEHPLNPYYWKETLDKKWVPAGKAKQLYEGYDLNEAGDSYRSLAEIVEQENLTIPIGAILVMKVKRKDLFSGGHMAVYMGCYNGTHYIGHITGQDGAGRGPEVMPIDMVENRWKYTGMSYSPGGCVIAIYSITGSVNLTVKTETVAANGYSKISVAGSEYKVFSDLHDMEGSIVGTFTIDENGKSNTLELMPGSYYFKQTKASDGFRLNTTIKSLNVSTCGTTSLTATPFLDTNYRYFVDVDGSNIKGDEDYQYYFNSVYWALNNGITKGYPGKEFRPANNCERREMMIFLWRLAGKPKCKGDARDYFSDMEAYPENTDSNKAVAWGYETGLIKGYSISTVKEDATEDALQTLSEETVAEDKPQTTSTEASSTETLTVESTKPEFRPTGEINRLETMIILYRMADKPETTGENKFTDTIDLAEGSDSLNSVIWGSKVGITSGYADETFRPYDNCLREHIVTFIYRAITKDLI